jgi:CheY-like chemotaxis protein
MGAPTPIKHLMATTPLLDNRLLILEDNKTVAQLLRYQAEAKGMIAFIAANKEQFRQAFLRLRPSMLMLDIMLGDDDVLPVIDFLVAEGCKCPVFFLTGQNHEILQAVSERARANGLMMVGAFEKKGPGITRLMQKIDSYILS